jgi:hypothetical protein
VEANKSFTNIMTDNKTIKKKLRIDTKHTLDRQGIDPPLLMSVFSLNGAETPLFPND